MMEVAVSTPSMINVCISGTLISASVSGREMGERFAAFFFFFLRAGAGALELFSLGADAGSDSVAMGREAFLRIRHPATPKRPDVGPIAATPRGETASAEQPRAPSDRPPCRATTP